MICQGKEEPGKKDPLIDNFAQEFKAEHERTELRINPGGEISMSDAISVLIEPHRQDAPNIQSIRALVSLACLAWNLSIVPGAERQKTLEKMIALSPDVESRVETLALIMELMDRKHLLFPDVRRTIVEWKVTEQGKDFHIAVASTIEKKDDPI